MAEERNEETKSKPKITTMLNSQQPLNNARGSSSSVVYTGMRPAVFGP